MPPPNRMLPFILKALEDGPMTANQLAKASGFSGDSLRKILTQAADDMLIHRVQPRHPELRGYWYALGATSYQAVQRMNGHPGKRPVKPLPEIRRDRMVAVLFPLPKPVARRDPFQAMFFGAPAQAEKR